MDNNEYNEYTINDQYIYSYYKNKKAISNGCNRRCPCRSWIQCPYYQWWKKYKNYWLEKWKNEQRYKAAHEKLDGSMDFHISSIANG